MFPHRHTCCKLVDGIQAGVELGSRILMWVDIVDHVLVIVLTSTLDRWVNGSYLILEIFCRTAGVLRPPHQ